MDVLAKFAKILGPVVQNFVSLTPVVKHSIS